MDPARKTDRNSGFRKKFHCFGRPVTVAGSTGRRGQRGTRVGTRLALRLGRGLDDAATWRRAIGRSGSGADWIRRDTWQLLIGRSGLRCRGASNVWRQAIGGPVDRGCVWQRWTAMVDPGTSRRATVGRFRR